MPRLSVAAAVALLPSLLPAAPRPSADSAPVPPPNTWAVSSPDGRFLFVMRGATPDEPAHPAISDGVRARSRRLWHEYPRSGLYRHCGGELLWATDERLELRTGHRPHHVLVTPTGSVVWLSHPPCGTAADSDDAHTVDPPADGPALRLLTDGETVAEVAADALVADPATLPGGRWLADVDAEDDVLTLTTRDEWTITIDLTTGAELGRHSPRGASLTRWGLILAAALAASAGLARARKRPPPSPAVAAVPAEPDALLVTPPPPGLGRRRSGWHVPVRR